VVFQNCVSLPPKAYDAFCASHLASTVEQPLVKSVFEGALRVFGMSPGSVYKMFGKSWAMLSSGCGIVSIEGDPLPSGTIFHVSELRVEEPLLDLFVRGFRATCRGAIDVVNKQGNMQLRSFDPGTRLASYIATWW
jgi:hypothetical protein